MVCSSSSVAGRGGPAEQQQPVIKPQKDAGMQRYASLPCSYLRMAHQSEDAVECWTPWSPGRGIKEGKGNEGMTGGSRKEGETMVK
jgi:hypothetical protein